METNRYRLLTINPGSTSTKLGVFDNTTEIFSGTVRHSKEELSKFGSILEQGDMRLKLVEDMLSKNNIELSSIDAFVGRGGILRPMESGVYSVNESMLYDLQHTKAAIHASALGGIFARRLGDRFGKPAFIVDPVVVDERIEVAKISGIPNEERTCVFHALNQKSIARRYAASVGKRYEDCNIIIAHLGGGISVGAHTNGRVIDVNNAIDGDGPFTPERCGSVQLDRIIKMCFSGNYTEAQMLAFTSKQGGLSAHLGTTDCIEVEERIDCGDEYATLVYNAMCYNIGKQIGAMAAALNGNVEAVILTGGLAYSELLTEKLTKMVSFIAPVHIFPGEDELGALAEGALRVLRGEEAAKEY